MARMYDGETRYILFVRDNEGFEGFLSGLLSDGAVELTSRFDDAFSFSSQQMALNFAVSIAEVTNVVTNSDRPVECYQVTRL